MLLAYRYCNFGGVTSVLKQRLPALRAAGWEVHCLFGRDDGGRPDLLRAGASQVDIVARGLADQFVTSAREGAYQALLVIDTPEVLSRAVSAGLPVCYEMHTSLPRGIRGLTAETLCGARRVVVPSDWSRRWLQLQYPPLPDEQISVCPNPVQLPVPADTQADTGAVPAFHAGQKPLLWVGKLGGGKQWQEMLHTAARVCRQRPETPVLVVTGGKLDSLRVGEFLARAEALGLSAHLQWLHNLSQSAMAELYRAVARARGVLLSCSRRESFCFTVHEAMWSGVPVVAAPAGAVREVLDSGCNALMYPPGDDRLAAEQILSLFSDQPLHERLAREGLATVRARFHPRQLLADYLALLDRLRPNPELAEEVAPFKDAPVSDEDRPRVSVVMTAWNAADSIEAAMRSVLEQSERDLELIVVDDASEDDTAGRVEAMAAEDGRVRLLRCGENRGTYWAKNLGLMMARGQYIALHDADDTSDPARLAVQIAELEEHPQAWICYVHWQRVDEHGEVLLNRGRQARPGYPSALFRRELIARVGFFDAVRVGADDEFQKRVRAVLGAEATRVVDRVLYWAPIAGDSLTGQNPVHLSLRDDSDPASYLSESRRAYIAAFNHWHRSGEQLLMPFPLRERYVVSPPSIRSEIFPPAYRVVVHLEAGDVSGQLLAARIRDWLARVDLLCLVTDNAVSLPDGLHDEPRLRLMPERPGEAEDKAWWFDEERVALCLYLHAGEEYHPNYVSRVLLSFMLGETRDELDWDVFFQGC
nr:glycosyltransferase [Natronospira proteinivora]